MIELQPTQPQEPSPPVKPARTDPTTDIVTRDLPERAPGAAVPATPLSDDAQAAADAGPTQTSMPADDSGPSEISKGPAPVVPTLVWVGVLLVVCLAGGLILKWYRREVFADAAEGDGEASVMEVLREARARGEISQDEYDSTRAKLAARLRRQMETPKRG